MSGSLSHTPAQILQQWLIDLAIAGGKTSSDTWPCYYGHMPDAPNDALCVYDTTPIVHTRVALGTTIQHYGNQIKIRTDATADGNAKAQAIVDALDAVIRTAVTVSATAYKIQAIHHDGIVYLGPEVDQSTRRRLYTINTNSDINAS